MNAATTVGRVGGLAMALGVGLALSSGSAVAWADGPDTSASTTAETSAGTPTDTSAAPTTRVTVKRAGRVPGQSSPAPLGRHRGAAASIAAPAPRTPTSTQVDAPVKAAAAVEAVSPAAVHVVIAAKTIPVPAASIPGPVVTPVAPAAAVTAPAVMSTEASSAPPPATGIAGVVNGLLAVFGTGPLAATSPLAPLGHSAMWGLLAWARKEFGHSVSLAGPGTAAAAPVAAVAVTPTTTPVAWVTGSGTTGPSLLPRTNNTAVKFGIAGTDVGAMWDNGIADNPATAVDEHQILIAFGDTFSGTGQTGVWRSNVLLRSSDHTPADGITVAAGVLGDAFSGSPLSSPNFSRQFIKSPGYLGSQGSEVTIIPTAGVSVPYNNSYGARQYVSFMSVKSWDTPGRWTTNYAAVAYSDDNGQNWMVAPSSIRSSANYRTTKGYVSGNQNFQQSAFVVPPTGSADANYVYAFGTPSGRGGTVYLSRVNQSSVLDQTKYEYWNGTGWVPNKPAVATPILPSTTKTGLFSSSKTYPTAGEMSVQYNTYLNKYVMMYADSGNNVVMRTADVPQGPWSAPTTLATSVRYAGLYAPMMDPWTTGQDIYWNMSMWGDYNVLLMHTRLV